MRPVENTPPLDAYRATEANLKKQTADALAPLSMPEPIQEAVIAVLFHNFDLNLNSLADQAKLMKAVADLNTDLSAFGDAMSKVRSHTPVTTPPSAEIQELQTTYQKLFGTDGTGGDFAKLKNEFDVTDDNNPLADLKKTLDNTLINTTSGTSGKRLGTILSPTDDPKQASSLSSLLQQSPPTAPLLAYAGFVNAQFSSNKQELPEYSKFNSVNSAWTDSVTSANSLSQTVSLAGSKSQNSLQSLATAMSKWIEDLKQVTGRQIQNIG